MRTLFAQQNATKVFIEIPQDPRWLHNEDPCIKFWELLWYNCSRDHVFPVNVTLTIELQTMLEGLHAIT